MIAARVSFTKDKGVGTGRTPLSLNPHTMLLSVNLRVEYQQPCLHIIITLELPRLPAICLHVLLHSILRLLTLTNGVVPLLPRFIHCTILQQ